MADPIYAVRDPQTLLTGPVGELRPSANDGKSLFVRVDTGEVLSLQPNGTQEWRPKGTDGAFEQCTPDGNTLIYAYWFDEKPYMHVVAFKGYSGTFV